MSLRRVLILFCAIFVVSGCDNDDLAQPIDPPVLTTDELIIADCYALRDALEAFAAENDSVYPSYLTDQSDAGNRFIRFLPGDTQLNNHYTGLANGPLFHDPQWPGEIGVMLYSESPAWLGGYRIVGRGRYGELIRIENVSRISQGTVAQYDSVIANCGHLITAVENFRAAAGWYPADTGADALPSGETLVDLLPGGSLLRNPITGVRDSPVDGAASWTGTIGYQPQDRNGDGLWDGFVIDGLGADGATVIVVRASDSPENESTRWAALVLRDAVEDFAAQNGDEFPRDVDTDETPSGNTLIELASYPFPNPYTGRSPYHSGLTTSRGEVGYMPVEEDGVVVGYVINALGLFNEELERFEVLP